MPQPLDEPPDTAIAQKIKGGCFRRDETAWQLDRSGDTVVTAAATLAAMGT